MHQACVMLTISNTVITVQVLANHNVNVSTSTVHAYMFEHIPSGTRVFASQKPPHTTQSTP